MCNELFRFAIGSFEFALTVELAECVQPTLSSVCHPACLKFLRLKEIIARPFEA